MNQSIKGIVIEKKKIAIVGAGPSGTTIARICAEAGAQVTIFEKRDHIGGNCHDQYNSQGVLIHTYGPHYFRSDSLDLLKWLSNFTQWQPAQYIVKAQVDGKLLPLPISLSTMVKMTGEVFDEERFSNYLEDNIIPCNDPKNAEEFTLSQVGRELYDKVFKNYTSKQWGVAADQLPPSITARIPLRFSFDERYPREKFQLMPVDGYTEMFKKIIDHSNIAVKLNSPLENDQLKQIRNEYDLMVYTGPIDLFYDFCFGKLEYRSLNFNWCDFPMAYKQPCVQINYPNEFDFTRTVEIKHVTGQISDNTAVCYEYPCTDGDPLYPILTSDNQERYVKYAKMAEKDKKDKKPVYFTGRLAEFKYYNMDQVFLKAMKVAQDIISI